MAFSFGFSHAYELHYSLFPWRNGSFADRVVHTVERLGEVGAAWWRPHIPWNRVEPRILKPGLRKADVTDAMVAEYAAGAYPGVDWSETDLWVNMVTRAGIGLHIGLGIAYVSQLPLVEVDAKRVLFTPGCVHPEIYLGHLFLHARAAGVLLYCFVSQEGYPGNEWHKRRPWNDVEDYWGLFRADDTARPAFHWLKQQ